MVSQQLSRNIILKKSINLKNKKIIQLKLIKNSP